MSSAQEGWVLDAGNTRIKLAIFRDDKVVQVLTDEAAEKHGRRALDKKQMQEQMLIAASGELTPFWNEWSKLCTRNQTDTIQLFNLNAVEGFDLDSSYESMGTLGLDRAANARAVLSEDSD